MHPSLFLGSPTSHILIFLIVVMTNFPLMLYFVAYSVHGPPEAASDACQAPARPDLPTACATAQSPPLHLHPDAVPGFALDPEVHCSSYHLPCNGEFVVQSFHCMVQNGTKL